MKGATMMAAWQWQWRSVLLAATVLGGCRDRAAPSSDVDPGATLLAPTAECPLGGATTVEDAEREVRVLADCLGVPGDTAQVHCSAADRWFNWDEVRFTDGDGWTVGERVVRCAATAFDDAGFPAEGSFDFVTRVFTIPDSRQQLAPGQLDFTGCDRPAGGSVATVDDVVVAYRMWLHCLGYGPDQVTPYCWGPVLDGPREMVLCRIDVDDGTVIGSFQGWWVVGQTR